MTSAHQPACTRRPSPGAYAGAWRNDVSAAASRETSASVEYTLPIAQLQRFCGLDVDFLN